MNEFFARYKIGKRIAFIAGVPLICLLILVLVNMNENYKKYLAADTLNEAVVAITELGSLAHVLQVERGRTAGYIGGGAGVVPDGLTKARQDVDAELQKYHAVVEHIQQVMQGEVIDALASIEAELTNLDSFRVEAENGSVSGAQNMAFFSTIIDHIIEVGFHAAEYSSSGKVALEVVAMLNLSEAKEYAGRERGLIAGILAKGQMSEAQLAQFNKHIVSQNILTTNFIANEPAEYRPIYEKLLSDSGIGKVEALRAKIIAGNRDIASAQIDPSNWFQSTTDRILALRNIEQKAATAVLADSTEIANSALSTMVFGLAISIIGGLATILSAAVITRSITQSLGSLVGSMSEISQGNLGATIEGEKYADEIGTLSRSLAVFREQAVEKVQMEKEAASGREQADVTRAQNDSEKANKAQQIQSAVDTLGDAMDKLAQGDLSVSIDTQFTPELDDLRKNFNTATNALSETFTEVKYAIETINSNASEIRGSASDLSTRTEQQAHSLQEASAAVEEITVTVQGSAKDTGDAASKAVSARSNTATSVEVVGKAMESMERIKKASEEIASIINVIDEISFQTNLLALNAGVEAARAGDSGRGFAVVAQEVRELAQRSTSAAKNIKQLIERSSAEVAQGVGNVTATGSALETIAQDVSEISEFVESIAVATNEQSIALGECTKSVNTLDSSTQQNAAMAEESTAVTHQLAADAERLAGMVARFKLKGASSAEIAQAA